MKYEYDTQPSRYAISHAPAFRLLFGLLGGQHVFACSCSNASYVQAQGTVAVETKICVRRSNFLCSYDAQVPGKYRILTACVWPKKKKKCYRLRLCVLVNINKRGILLSRSVKKWRWPLFVIDGQGKTKGKKVK
jgi:hypothetical protein